MERYSDVNAAECLNRLSHEETRAKLEYCCASQKWVAFMLRSRPFADNTALQRAAEQAADLLQAADWKEAFAGHPRIGDLKSLHAKYASTKDCASSEQAGVNSANEDTLKELASCNDLYFEKFGYIFIVCATGKSAAEMLSLLQRRLQNQPEAELKIAADEQRKITRLRLEKMSQQK